MAKNKSITQEELIAELLRLRQENEILRVKEEGIKELSNDKNDSETVKNKKKKVKIVVESASDGDDEESDNDDDIVQQKNLKKNLTKNNDEVSENEIEKNGKRQKNSKSKNRNINEPEEAEKKLTKKKSKWKEEKDSDDDEITSSKQKGKKNDGSDSEEFSDSSEEEEEKPSRKRKQKEQIQKFPKSIDKLFPKKVDRNKIQKIGEHSFFYPVDTGNITSYDNVYFMYVRVSTSQQRREGHSIRSQQSIVKRYVRSKKGFLRGVYLDAGITGASLTKRKAFKHLCENVKDREKIVVYDFSRLGRTRKLTRLMEKFYKRKIYFVSSTDDISTDTNEGQKQFDDQIAQAVLERNKSIKRVETTLGYMSANGKLRGRAPYGWKNDKNKKKYVKVKKEQEAIKIIKEMRLKHRDWSWTKLCHELDSTVFPVGSKYEGQLLPKRKSRRFYVPQVKAILQRQGLNVNYGYNFLKERGPQQYYRKGIKDDENETDSDTGTGSSSSDDERNYSDDEDNETETSSSDEYSE